jgi:glycosyltransferase involved in cell wall biosynthesis
MRIIILGNAPWVPSGYGEQIGLLAPRLRALGHEVACAANHGLQGMVSLWNGIPVFPAVEANSSIGPYAEQFGADVVLCLHDAWVMKPDAWPDEMTVGMYAPVDHFPIPPLVVGVLQHEKVRPIAMSRDGEQWMRSFALDPMYAPHAVDTKVFKPQPEMRDAMRDGMGIPRDAFLIGMVGANQGWNPHICRKAFPQAIQAFAEFLADHDDAWLYMHTNPLSGGRGTPLEPLILAENAACPVDLMGRIRFPDERELLFGVERPHLAAQYAAFDVLLNPSMGEGFGVPIIEAQACGVPVITSDHSAMTELTHAGWLVEGEPWWDSLQTSFAFMPSIRSIREKLELAYEARDDQELRASAAEFALAYDADLVAVQYWEPIIEQLAGPREVPPLNGKRKQVRKREAAERRAEARA